jgi:hypothetical protein
MIGSPDVIDQLRRLIASNDEPLGFMGIHICELCESDGPAGAANLFVPTGDRIFVCPELIVHYIIAHRYRPPDSFQDAVLRCPDPRGPEYRELFLESGAGALLSHRGQARA